jgi:hypothetical protein
MKKIYWIVGIVIIILLLLFALPYWLFCCPGGTLSREAAEQAKKVGEMMQKSVKILSANCSGSPDTIKFIINHTGTLDIESGDLLALLDGDIIQTIPDIKTYSIEAGNISIEFSYNAPGDEATRRLTVSAPAATVDKILTCS